jgi:hypothetical protein
VAARTVAAAAVAEARTAENHADSEGGATCGGANRSLFARRGFVVSHPFHMNTRSRSFDSPPQRRKAVVGDPGSAALAQNGWGTELLRVVSAARGGEASHIWRDDAAPDMGHPRRQ